MGSRYDRREECRGASLPPAEPVTYRNHLPDRGACPVCGKRNLALTTAGNIWSHKPKPPSRWTLSGRSRPPGGPRGGS
jgi:hypothetical protein